MGSIIVISKKQRGEFLPLGHRTSVIGRAESLPLQLLDKEVSRKHLQIHYESAAGKYCAIDLSSKNGVFVNNVKIDTETPLSDGDILVIGETELLFTEKEIDDTESALNHYKQVGERDHRTLTMDNGGRDS